MRKKQLLITAVITTLAFYSLNPNPTIYDERLEMEEEDKHSAILDSNTYKPLYSAQNS